MKSFLHNGILRKHEKVLLVEVILFSHKIQEDFTFHSVDKERFTIKTKYLADLRKEVILT